MATAPFVHLGGANLGGTVLDNLKTSSPAQAFIRDTLNAALKARLVSAATVAKQDVLVSLLQAMPAADLVASKDVSVHDFVSKQITLPTDPTARAAAEAAIAQLSTKTTIADLLGLNSNVKDNPLFAGEVQRVNLQALLGTSPALGEAQLQDDFINRYANFTGTIQDLWTQLKQDAEFKAVVPELQLTLQLGLITLNSSPLVTALRASSQPKSPRDLTKLTATDWTYLIASKNIAIPDAILGSTPSEKTANYVNGILQLLQAAYPTDYIAQGIAQLAAKTQNPTDLGVSQFLKNSPDFDFKTTKIDDYVNKNKAAALQNIPVAQQAAVLSELKTYQRLSRVSTDFQTISALKSAGFTSAHSVASTPQSVFLQKIGNQLGNSQAATIHAGASHIASQSVNLFTTIRTALDGVAPMVTGQVATEVQGILESAGIPNWQNLFGSSSYCECEDCRSVLSAAAYFVDVLQFLKKSSPNSQGNTPLDILLGNRARRVTGRRPDLAYLKLNCENTNTPLPYVDLVNEILETFVVETSASKKPTLDSAAAHDTSKNTTADELSVNPEYTNADAYNNVLNAGSVVYPPMLPFDRWLETARTYLEFLGTSLNEVMDTFQVAGDPSDVTKGSPTGLALACEYLKISQAECVILTGKDFSDKAPSTTHQPYEFYGYQASQAGSWLSDIAQVPQFLQRTGIAYDDLVQLLRTRFLNSSQQIMLRAPGDTSQNAADHSCDLTVTSIVDLSQAGFTLQESTLDHMHRFIRLWKKLGWTIGELDKTCTAMAASDINTDLIVKLSQILELQTTLNVPLVQLLSFWANMDTDGRDSLWMQLFQNKAVLNPPDSVFQLQYVTKLATMPTLSFPSPLFPNIVYDDSAAPPHLTLTINDQMAPAEVQDEQNRLLSLSLDTNYASAINSLFSASSAGSGNTGTYSVSLTSIPTAALPQFLTLPSFVTYDPAGKKLSIVGAMTSTQQAQLLAISTDPNYQNAVNTLFTNSQAGGTATYSVSLVQLPNLVSYDATGGQLSFSGAMSDDQRAQFDFSVDVAFQTAVDALYGLRTFSDVNPADAWVANGLSNRVNTILAALRISAADLALLRAFTGLMDSHAVRAMIHLVNVPNLSILFRYVLLARALAVSIDDLISLITLMGVAPTSANSLFANPSTTLAFVKLVRQFQASAFFVAQLNYLYRDLYDPNSGMAPLPANVTLLLTNLQSGLAKIARENELIADPKGDLLRRKLASLLGSSVAGTTLELVNGTAVYTAPLAALPAISLPGTATYDKTAQQLSISGAMALAYQTQLLALSPDQDYQAAVKSLYAISQAGGAGPFSVPLAELPDVLNLFLSIPMSYDSRNQDPLALSGPVDAGQEAQLVGLSSVAAYVGAVTNLCASSATSTVFPITYALTALPPGVVLPDQLRGLIAFDSASHQLRYTGPMTDDAKSTLSTLSADAAYQGAVNSLYQQPRDFISQNLGAFLNPSDAINQLLKANGLSTAGKIDYILRQLMPYLRKMLSESFVKQTLSDNLQLDPKLTDLLVGTLLNSQTQPAPAKAMADFLALVGDGLAAEYFPKNNLTAPPAFSRTDATVNFDWQAGLPASSASAASISSKPFSVRWSGFVFPQFSENYTFYVKAGDGVALSVNGRQVINNQWNDQPITEHSVVVLMIAGQLTSIELDYYDNTAPALAILSWSSPSTPKAVIPQTQLFSGAPVSSLTPMVRSYALIFKVAILARTFGMTADDIGYFAGPAHRADFGSLDLNALPLNRSDASAPSIDAQAPALFAQWERLNSIVKLINGLPGGDAGVLDIFAAAAAGSTTALSDSTTQAILLATGWDKGEFGIMTGSSGFGLVDADFRNEAGTKGIGMVALQSCMALATRLGVSVNQLFTWAGFGSAPAQESDISKDIQNTAKAKYDDSTWVSVGKPLNDKIREESRDALIAFILANAGAWGMTGITTSDQLYEYFLIDVDMGTCMLTSRMVQANAAVQLFVQRCLMNLEAEVNPSSISAEWEWMKNYRVWQANREVFLYPENWILPQLRDDKTSFFKDLENQLLQNDVNADTVEQAYLNYLNKLDEVARLDFRGLYWQYENGAAPPDGALPGTSDVLHVFARTFSTPYVYYYRRLLNCGQSGGYSVWSPWEQVQVDIQGDHLVPVVWNRRLFLFWPVFQEAPTDPTSSVTPPLKTLKIQLAWSEYKQGAWSNKHLSSTSLTPFFYGSSFSFYSGNLDTSLFAFAPTTDGSGNLSINAHYGVQRCQVGQFTFTGCGGSPSPHPDAPAPKSQGVLPLISFENYPIPDTPVIPENTVFEYQELVEQDGTLYPKQLVLEDGIPNFSSPVQTLLNAPTPYDLVFAQQCFPYFSVVPPPPFPNQPFFYEDAARIYFVKSQYAPAAGQLTNNNFVAGPISANQLYGSSLSGLGTNTIFGDPSAARATNADTSLPVAERKITNQAGPAVTFDIHSHPHVCDFINTLNWKGIPELLALRTQQMTNDDAQSTVFGETYRPSPFVVMQPYPQENVDFSPSGAYSLYNSELFFHIPLLIATRLSQNQQFKEAQKWFHYIFNPTTNSTDPAPNRYWNFLPFYENTASGQIAGLLAQLEYNGSDQTRQEEKDQMLGEIDQWRHDPFNPHLIARLRPIAYQKTVVMKYLDNLIAWGDYLFNQNTRESINEATQLYVLAQQILGPRPTQIPSRTNAQDYTYHDLNTEFSLDDFSNTLVLLENQFPFVTDGASASGVASGTPSAFSAATISFYFCIPANDQLLGYWDIVADRLFKIRHCMNIAGGVEQLPLFSPPISPALLVQAAAMGVDLGSVLNDIDAALPNYRFTFMLQKAMELCAEVRSFGAGLLSALEKKDAEHVALLRATQETVLLTAIKAVKQKQIDEANRNLEGLQKSHDLAQIRQTYYTTLLSAASTLSLDVQAGPVDVNVTIPIFPMSTFELLQLGLIAGSLGAQLLQGYLHLGGVVAHLMPEITLSAGPPSVQTGGVHVGDSIQAMAAFVGSLASILSTGSSAVATMAGFERRAEEWDFQKRLADKELEQIDKQMAAAQIRLDIAGLELANQQTQIDNAAAVEDFLRTKFTTEDLYSWMVTQVSTVYFQCYQLAYETAKKAEKAFRFERGLAESSYIQFGYWDSLKQGLLSGERMYSDLKRMEMAYLDLNTREYEISKNISLVLLDPLALIALKETGHCVVGLPEAFFDMDYPGHYMRRIKSVSLTIPCVTGPYTSVNCTLTLLQSKIRTDSVASSLPDYSSDSHFLVDYAATQSIATSSAQNDSGMFELNFRDERYLPFEGAGIISTWRIDLPPENNAFDFETISDVIMNLRYTARDGGDELRLLAKQAAVIPTFSLQAGPAGGAAAMPNQNSLLRLFSLKHEFPTDWYKFLNPPNTATAQTMQIGLTIDRFPYQYRGRTIQISSLDLFLKFKDLHDSRFTTDGTPLGDYAAGAPLSISVVPPSGAVLPPALLRSASTLLNGTPFASISLPSGSKLGPSQLVLQSADIQKIALSLRSLQDEKNLNPAVIDDVVVVCHYSAT